MVGGSMRKAVIGAVILAACVALATGGLILFVDVNHLRPQIEAQLQKGLERPVTLGRIGLKFIPLSIRVENVTIGEAPPFPSQRPFVSAKEINIRAGLMPLLRKQIQVSSLVLREPAVELIKNERGSWNYATMGRKPSGDSPQSVALERLEVINGTVAVTDLQAGESRTVYDHIDLEMAMPKEGLTAKGSLRPFGGEINATLSVARLSAPSPTVTGSGTATNLSLPAPSLLKPLLLRSASFTLDADELKLSNVQCSLGASTLRGTGSVRNFSAPKIQFTADIDQVDAGELQRLMAPAKSTTSRGTGGFRNVTGGGTLGIGSLRYNDVILSHVKATCTLDRGLIRLAPIESQLSGGMQAGGITVDTRGEHPAFAVKSKLEKVDANQLLSSTTSLKQIIYGLLAGEADTTFVSRPGQDIASSLNGEVRLQLTEGKIQGANLLNEMAVLGRFLNAVKRSETFTSIVRLTGTLKIKDGIASTDDLRLDFGGGAAGAAGTINLVDQSLNLQLTTIFGKDVSQRAGGTQIGGFMSTVLANPKGELVIPAIVSGTFAKPHFAPDARRFAEMKLRSLLPTSEDPGSGRGLTQGVRDVVDALRGKKDASPEPGAAGSNVARPVDSLIDLFRRKKDSKPPQP